MDATTFRWDPDQGVLWAGVRSYPATFHRSSMQDHMPPDRLDAWNNDHPGFHMETRQAHVWFENQWQLSVIWGDTTYSSNSWHYRHNLHLPDDWPFIEEPTLVEVGILVPDAASFIYPPVVYELPSGSVEMPERETTLWNDPLGYVDVPTFHRVAELVSMLPTDVELPEGEWDTAEGFCDFLVAAGLERTL